MKKLLDSTPLFLFLLILISVFIILPFFNPGLPKTDDGVSMALRASAFHQSLKDGHFPVRWLGRLNENYGYPVTNYLYPLPFYLAEIPNFLGFSAPDSVKIIFICSTVVSSLGMFLWLSTLSPPLPAFVGAIVYTVAPYRLITLYQRGSLGESVAFALLPLILFAYQRYIKSRKTHYLILAAVLHALLITAHNSLALIASPVLLLYFFFLSRSKRSPYRISYFIILAFVYLLLTFSLSAFFWLPAIGELGYTRAPSIQISQLQDQFASPLGLVSQLGLLSLFIIWAAMGFVRSGKGRFWIFIYTIALTVQIPIVLPVWQSLKLDHLIQFPIRFMSLAVLATAVCTSLLLSRLTELKPKVYAFVGYLLIVLLLFLSTPNIYTFPIDQFSQNFFETNFDTSTNQKEFTPKSVKIDPTTYATVPFEITGPTDSYTVTESMFLTQKKYLQLVVNDTINFSFNTHAFPGWRVFIDGVEMHYDTDDFGRITFPITSGRLPAKTRDIQLVWQETPLRLIADTTSFFAWLVVFVYFTFHLTKKHLPRTISFLALFTVTASISSYLFINRGQLLAKFNPQEMEQKYLNSQWVNPNSNQPLGDHGLYAWAGWAYVHGENPILINSEMPPLGKYLIGLGILLTGRPGIVGLFFALTFLVSVFLLAKVILKQTYLSLIPIALLSLEPIFQGLLTTTMLDGIQLTFLCLMFLFLIKSVAHKKFFIPVSLMLGGVLATKFYATGILVLLAVILFYFLTRNKTQLKYFLFSLPLALAVHVLSYLRFFTLGNSLLDYLKVQKFIYAFYQSGAPSLPLGSYWGLVFFNRWQVWWGESWGEKQIITASQWLPTWPVNALVALIFSIMFIRHLQTLRHTKKIHTPRTFLLTAWLLIYSLFLTKIGGWPHYMLLFLPFSNILLVCFLVRIKWKQLPHFFHALPVTLKVK